MSGAYSEPIGPPTALVSDALYGEMDFAAPRHATQGKSPGGYALDTSRPMSVQEAKSSVAVGGIKSLVHPKHSPLFYVAVLFAGGCLLNGLGHKGK